MAFATFKNYLCVFEFEGSKHVARLAAISQEKAAADFQRTNDGIKILEVRPATLEEIQDAAEQLRDADPLHVPITNADIAPKPDGPAVAQPTL